MIDPMRPTDDAAIALARALLDGARHAVLGTLDGEGFPHLSRIGLQTDEDGAPLALLSGLAAHSRALAADPRAGLLLSGPDAGAKGSLLTRPRLSLQVMARMLPPGDEVRRARWRERDPKSAAYLDLPDFRFWRLEPRSGLLNAGFGRAYRLTAAELLRQ